MTDQDTSRRQRLALAFGFWTLPAPDRLPLVLFATAFAEHALQAFNTMAVDYVLKVIEQTRFDQAMARVNQHGPAHRRRCSGRRGTHR